MMEQISGVVDDAVTRDGATEQARRPKLLFLCHTLPFPPDEGVRIRAFNLLRQLARTFDITALCFYRDTGRTDSVDVRATVARLEEVASVRVIPVPQSGSVVRFCWDHVRSALRQRAYTSYVYESARYARELRTVLAKQSYDLVHVDSLDLVGYLPMLDGLQVACGHHNVESSLLRSRLNTDSSWLRRRYMAMQARLLENVERRWCDRVALNVMVSAVDSERLLDITPDARTLIVPNGVDTPSLMPADHDGTGILFMGGYGWAPNRDAMEYFCEAILPLIRARVPAAGVTWLGRAPAAVCREYARRHGVRMTGYVEDIRSHLEAAACCVVPLRAGGGTRLKILDAWSAGHAVVSTRIGCEGLAAHDDENILIRDDPGGFASAVCDVLENPVLRRRLGINARATAEESYDWERIGAALNHEYQMLAVSAQRSSPLMNISREAAR